MGGNLARRPPLEPPEERSVDWFHLGRSGCRGPAAAISVGVRVGVGTPLEHFGRKQEVQQEADATSFLLKLLLPAEVLENSC